MSGIDALTLAVIQAGLQQVCNEMDIAFSRAAFSPVIAEADDRSDGIYDRATGALIAQGEFGLPVFVGTMQYSTGELIRLIREGRAGAPEPGDVYIVNDPYLGGTHLMDVRFANPSSSRASCSAGSRTRGTGPISAAWCRAASRRMPRRWNRRACGCRR
jgi:N-methylhydantoinase B